MRAFPKLRDFLFRLRYGFRGVPVKVGERTIRLDESLRRWEAKGELHVQDLLNEHLKLGDCMLDIGANFGLHSLLAGTLVGPTGEVHAFEPLPENLKMLRHHVKINHLEAVIRVTPSAVSDDKSAQVSFFSGAEAAGVTASLTQSGGNNRKVTVANVMLDDYAKRIQGPVRLVKIDVEGAEVKVLRGGREFFQANRALLVIEVHAFAFADFGTSLEEFHELIRGLGYDEQVLPGTVLRDGQHYQAVYRPVAINH